MTGHVYVSTACHHDLHDRCRRTCKFCSEPCRCLCHHTKGTAMPETPETVDNPAVPDADLDDESADATDEQGYDDDTRDDRVLPGVVDDGQDDTDPEADAEDDGDDGAEAAPEDPFDVEPVEGATNPLTGEPA